MSATKMRAALQLAKDMFIANDLALPHTFEVIDDALSSSNVFAVQPLVWEQNGVDLIVPSEFYTIMVYPGHNLLMRGVKGISHHPTLEEAKAAAQADYEQRILAALSLSPGSEENDRIAEARREALLEAETLVRSFWKGDNQEPWHLGYDDACSTLADEIAALTKEER